MRVGTGRTGANGDSEVVPGLRHVCESWVYDHTFDNADREVGGVLIGDPGASAPSLIAAIPALQAAEERAALTFTQDAWEHVHRVLEREYPGRQIVGWYHSHPGFGVFLSENDLFIHRNFFSDSSQIALVVDPIEGTEGVFGWSGEEVVEWTRGTTGRAPARASAGRDRRRVPTVGLARARAEGESRRLIIAAALLTGVLAGLLLWEGALKAQAAGLDPIRPTERSNTSCCATLHRLEESR
jgi:proteasome lid subunit RPN8/RPN11